MLVDLKGLLPSHTLPQSFLKMIDATRLVFLRFVTLERTAVVEEGTDGAHFVETHHHHQSHTTRLIVSLETHHVNKP